MANIFNRNEIYNTIFFNIQSVTEYGDIKEFEEKEPEKYKTWLRMAEKRYTEEFEKIASDGNLAYRIKNGLYLDKACFLPEFSKIINICYVTVTNGENGELKRSLKHVDGENEVELIKNFIEILNNVYAEGHYSKPSFVPTMCGHNIMGHDIPLFVKRIVKHREELKQHFAVPLIPLIVKHYLNCKPWESNVIDTVNVWKFNGSDFISLNLVSDLAELKKTVTLKSKEEINNTYWSEWQEGDDKMKYIKLQSANFVNVTLQLANELRQL